MPVGVRSDVGTTSPFSRETLNKFCVIHRDSRYIAEKEQSTANHEAKDIGDGKRL
jgi:hypothetical protein